MREVRRAHKIRYLAAEWTMIQERARRCGRPAARYVREASLGSVPKARRDRENDEVIRELGRIGTMLARLTAESAGSAGAGPPGIERILAELLATVRRLG